ncbi:hypothetical protein GCM10010260_60550 [Streptomyces filipinensis]|uniref:Tyrosine specific protein phosphatases domain-containing protein n=1 Tax=Streptomyces filipinensis TaxID=66887 RepID=A0A918MD59_9ACTN|nr:tyrosine-protein phosphatase [Streptomyces filipinensis]GGV13374.1 hypothetical protein GCM10010260_60550 [Streptomyces filipinensis]
MAGNRSPWRGWSQHALARTPTGRQQSRPDAPREPGRRLAAAPPAVARATTTAPERPARLTISGLYFFLRQVIGSKDQLDDGKAEERMRSLYQGFVTDPANRAALGAAIRDVANATGPVLFHCSAGEDRTGVLADTVLPAVGVPATTAEGDSND